MTKRVWIAQCLCPQRHCILAAAGEIEDGPNAESLLTPLRQNVADLLSSRAINPWCGLCHAPESDWFYEAGRTAFCSMAEAAPVLAQVSREMAVTRAAWGDMPRSD